MDARSNRWTEVTPSAFAHELAALDLVRSLLPDTYPYAAWSNFSFVSLNGAVREVDLLVLTPTGPVLLELKDWRGELTTPSRSGVWVSRHGGRDIPRDNPLILANQKAKELKSLLERAARRDGGHRTGPRVPYMRAAVFFSNPSMTCRLPDEDRHHLYGPPSSPGDARAGLPGIGDLLTATSGPSVDPDIARAFPALVKTAGISRTRASMHVGPWQLEPRPFDDGPTWQDYHATHQSMPSEYRRVRIYLTARGADAEHQRSIREAAQREFAAARGITHPAILVPAELAQHEAGPALVLEHRRDARRLDQYMATAGRDLGLDQRVELVREIAEAVRYAHSRSLVHRALSARAIFVEPTDGDWSHPQPRIGDWQVASRGVSGGPGTHVVDVTINADRHLDPASSPYLAPEFREGTEGAASLDVYGLGTLTYLILTGHPPAADQSGVLERLRSGSGLHPAAIEPSVPADLDALVALATEPDVADRVESAESFLELLADALPKVATAPGVQVDPLDAVKGSDMPDGTRVEEVLGTGSSARAFLVDHDGVRSVYKVARSDAAEDRLDAEFRVLDGLRHENIAGVRRGLFTLGSRAAIEVDYAGRQSVGRRLRVDGEFLPDQLDRFGRQLIEAVKHLESHDVVHRDIKPDNIGILERNATTRLVLFDFSLAGVPRRSLDAGTRGYLDPWLGEPRRPEFDGHAERYAVAATLHQMASLLVPEVTERDDEGGRHVIVASDLFAAPLRAALTTFFTRAFDPDTDRRFESAASMGRAWARVFAEVDQTLPTTTTDGDTRHVDDARQGLADRVRADTPLDAAGLSPRAVTVAQRLGAQTVNDLMLVNNRVLWTARGLSRATRTELVQRRSQWRLDLEHVVARHGRPSMPPTGTAQTGTPLTGRTDLQTPAERDDASATLVGVDALQYPIDVLVERLLPASAERPAARSVEVVRGLLGLDSLPPHTGQGTAWPSTREVADALSLTTTRVIQINQQARAQWSADLVLELVVKETASILDGLGRVAEIDEVAGQLLLRHGSTESTHDTRMRAARAVLRAVIGRSDDEFRQRPTGRRVLLALEITDDDSPDTPSAPGLLDLAVALGSAADQLATQDPLPAPATVVRTLQPLAVDAGLVVSESRLVALAAAAADRALAGPRLEVYPRDLAPVRALRLAQAGAGLPVDGLTPEQVRERVAGRLPGLPELPDGSALLALLRDAGFRVRSDGERIVPQTAPLTRVVDHSPTGTRLSSSGEHGVSSSVADADAPRAGDADDRLVNARETGGFRAVTARFGRLGATRSHLAEVMGVTPTDATREFLAGVRRVARESQMPDDLAVVFEADAEPRDSTNGRFLQQLVEEVFAGLRAAWLGPDAPAVLLLDNLTPLGRYDPTLRLVGELAERARRGGRDGNPRTVVLLCAAAESRRPPRIAGAPVVLLGRDEWVVGDSRWVIGGLHGSGMTTREGAA